MTTTQQHWLNSWKNHNNSPERDLLLAIFEDALNSWCTAKNHKQRELARQWFADAESWDVCSFNFITSEILGVVDLEGLRRIVLKQPQEVAARKKKQTYDWYIKRYGKRWTKAYIGSRSRTAQNWTSLD